MCTVGLDSNDEDGSENITSTATIVSSTPSTSTVSGNASISSVNSDGLPATITAEAPPDPVVPLVDLTERPEQPSNNHQSLNTVDEIVHATVIYCNENNIDNPTEILRCFQQQVVTGRALEVVSEDEVKQGGYKFYNG